MPDVAPHAVYNRNSTNSATTQDLHLFRLNDCPLKESTLTVLYLYYEGERQMGRGLEVSH